MALAMAMAMALAEINKMNEHEEMIFNLFLIEFMKDYPVVGFIANVFTYEKLIETGTFKMLKDCFPENEVRHDGIMINFNYIVGEYE